jgi:hypothetical protein
MADKDPKQDEDSENGSDQGRVEEKKSVDVGAPWWDDEEDLDDIALGPLD